MSHDSLDSNRRILIIDDHLAIHEDFRKILSPAGHSDQELKQSEAALFGDSGGSADAYAPFALSFAQQGEEGIAMVARARADSCPFPVAFIDVRMPPGCDGVETAAHILELDPDIQVVICTAYSDYSWQKMLQKLACPERVVVLKKPFDAVEVLQLADTLMRRWQLARVAQNHRVTLQQIIADRTRELNAATGRLEVAHLRLAVAAQQEQQPARKQADEASLQRLEAMRSELQEALASGQMSVHYQPLIEIASRRAIGLEALARWHHPTRGFISPGVFIPAAEETGMILELTEYVLRMVCEQVVRWEREGTPVVPVSVNISAVQLRGGGIHEFVRRILAETGMQPQKLVLELTESALIENVQQCIGELKSLQQDGVGIEIDDFGTGYSSLSYLKQLPIDTLKIDRSFIQHIDSNPVDATIVSAILAMAHSLQLRVVAEGVETAAQLQVLSRYGCGYAQGFFFSRPQPADACRELLVQLAARKSFTDTLRLQINSPSQGVVHVVPTGKVSS